jgi:acetyltransferase-like isoleucine patch superfamily enzyme
MNKRREIIHDKSYNLHAWIIGKPKIGKGTWIGAFTVIDGQGGLTIGKGCDISSGAHIYTHTTTRRCLSQRKYTRIDEKPVKIGDFVHIGANATILMGATIGDHSVIGAGCVIKEGAVIPAYSTVAGVPGKIIGKSNKFLIRRRKRKIGLKRGV